MLIFRQGDVLLRQVRQLPRKRQPVERVGGRIVLAEGEATGHAHAVLDERAELYEHSDRLEARFLRVLAEGGVSLTHDEHATITLPRGTYEVIRQREYEPGAVRPVSD
jgi:hypothetical protein